MASRRLKHGASRVRERGHGRLYQGHRPSPVAKATSPAVDPLALAVHAWPERSRRATARASPCGDIRCQIGMALSASAHCSSWPIARRQRLCCERRFEPERGALLLLHAVVPRVLDPDTDEAR